MSKTKPVEELSFEQAFAELEELVANLETGDLPLEESLALFERGQALSEHCSLLLQNAELKLRQLQPDEGGGVQVDDLQE
jgi:exodeoxyribonuclease VII small subunit